MRKKHNPEINANFQKFLELGKDLKRIMDKVVQLDADSILKKNGSRTFFAKKANSFRK
jgi:hypothetical protein